MPATRSSGPPTAASLQPILMEALENFKQKHSKQNQDLIHKNRVLLKTTSELERMIKELKNENLELRIQVQKANSQTNYWRQRADSSTSTTNQFTHNLEQTKQIRMALIEIANRCKTLESELPYPQPASVSNPSTSPDLSIPPFNSISAPSTSTTTDSLPTLLPARNRAELLALRERRRSQFNTDPEESRLSFINECSGAEDRSESTLPIEPWQSGSTDMQLPTSTLLDTTGRQGSGGFTSAPSNQAIKLLHAQFVVSRPNRRHELMAPVPKKSLDSRPRSEVSDHVRPPTKASSKTSAQHAQLELAEEEEEESDARSEQQNSEGQSLEDEQTSCSGSFSIHNRAMSQLDQSSSTNNYSSDSDQDSPDDKDAAEEQDENHGSHQASKDPNGLTKDTQWRTRQTQRRSRKQRRTSLTPLHILQNVSPSDFSLPLSTQPSSESPVTSNRLARMEETDESKLTAREINNPSLVAGQQAPSVKRRDSGLTKEEADGDLEDQSPRPDEGWEKRTLGKKKRVRAELDAVSEEHTPSVGLESAVTVSLSGVGSREARRARKEVNYALPSLNKKMRRPDSDSSTVKRKSSIRHPSNPSLPNSSTINTKPDKLSSSLKSSGATPSTVVAGSNTSCSTSTSLTLNSSPLSSVSSASTSRSTKLSHTRASSSNHHHHHLHLDHPPSHLKKPLVSKPSSSDDTKDIHLNRGRRRTNNL